MRDVWGRHGRLPLSLGLLLVWYLHYVYGASTGDLSVSLRSLSPSIKDAEVESAPPVFCLDAGVEIAFPSRDMEDAMGSITEAAAGKGCLRSSPMNAVVGHLKTSLRTFSLHAVDCVLEPMDIDTSTIALLGIVSLCSRSNMEVEEDMESWGRDAKRQVDKLFETEKRISFKQTIGMVRHVVMPPAYELPVSGSGLPQFILGETLIWSDGEEDGAVNESKDQTFFTHVQLHVKNDGKTPLHLYRLTLVQKSENQDKNVDFVLPLVAPAVVQPGQSEVVSFKAITGSAVDSSKSYLLYISHSGFRSHVFEGILDGKTYLSREESVQRQGEDGLLDRFSFDSTNGQSVFPGFPYASWQVGSMAIAVAVGIAVMLYIRRKRPNFRLMGHVVTTCFRSSGKKRSTQPGGRTPAKPVSNRIASSRATLSKKGEDHIEMESLINKPTATKTPNTGSGSSIQLPAPPRSKMPAITMKWKAPPPPPPRVHSASEKASLAVPKALEAKKELLDLDRKARLHPKRFESMWDEYVERFHSELPDSTRPDSGNLLKNMEAHGISCMASGTVTGVEKFVFYAKQRERLWFFLATVDVTLATATTVLTIRASSDAADELVVQFVDVVKTTLAQSALS